jgi:hypothetical protein
MNSALLRLELRKNVLAPASLIAAFFITLPVSRLVSSAAGLEPVKALEAILIGWLTVGLVFSAALIGAASGAQAASRDAHDAESLLPASPLRRAAAALVGALLLFAAVTAFIAATSWLCGLALSRLLDTARPGQTFLWGTEGWDLIPRAPLAILALLDALAACWILSYLTGNGIAGGLLGLLLAAASTSALLAGYGLQLFYATREWDADFSRFVVPLIALSLAGKTAAAAKAAFWRERRPRLGATGAAVLAGALLIGPVAGWSAVSWSLRGLRGQTRLSERDGQSVTLWSQAPATPQAVRAVGDEAALITFGGGLIMAGSGGARVAIPDDRAGLLDILLHPSDVWEIWDDYRDDSGLVWAERIRSFETELWRERPDGRMESRRVDGQRIYITRIAGRFVIGRWFDGRNEMLYADADDFYRSGDRAAWMRGIEGVASRAERESGAGAVSCGGNCLRAGGRTWRLPGRARAGDKILPRLLGGRRVFLVPVQLSSGDARVVACRPDGRVESAWRLRRTSEGWDYSYRVLPDGTLFARGPEDTLGLIDASGNVLPAVSLARMFRDFRDEDGRRLDVVRAGTDGVQVVRAGRLISVDARGEVRAAAGLPHGVDGVKPLHSGFLAHAKDGLYFIGWDGKTRLLPIRRGQR